jgi:hypothetical protein
MKKIIKYNIELNEQLRTQTEKSCAQTEQLQADVERLECLLGKIQSLNEIILRGQGLKTHCDDRDYEKNISFNQTQICVERLVSIERKKMSLYLQMRKR